MTWESRSKYTDSTGLGHRPSASIITSTLLPELMLRRPVGRPSLVSRHSCELEEAHMPDHEGVHTQRSPRTAKFERGDHTRPLLVQVKSSDTLEPTSVLLLEEPSS